MKSKRLTTNDLENIFHQYKEWTIENPVIIVKESYGKLLNVPHHRPMTLKGFYAYTMEHHGVDVHHYFQNSREAYNEFTGVCRNIKLQIHSELTTLALVGGVKENIASRILGLKEEVKVEEPRVFEIVIHKGEQDEQKNAV